jgi:hypothetical protein
VGVLEQKFTFSEWGKLLEAAGFRNYEILLEKDDQFAPNKLSALIRKISKRVPDKLMKILGSAIYVYAQK